MEKERYKNRPEKIPDNYKVAEIECDMCYGKQFYMGTYGMKPCEKCTRGKQFIFVKIYKKRK